MKRVSAKRIADMIVFLGDIAPGETDPQLTTGAIGYLERIAYDLEMRGKKMICIREEGD